jgi:hypothetical protein
VPAWLLLVRRPEDIGLLPDGRAPDIPVANASPTATPRAIEEPAFTRKQALRTPAFWLLSLYTAAVFPVQAGVSLHQAPHLIERGLSPTIAATVVSTFSLASGIAGLGFGMFTRRIGVHMSLALAGAFLGVSAVLMLSITTAVQAYVAACCFGIGIGRRAHCAAAGLGRLLRPRQLRRHPRRGADRASDRSGLGTVALRGAARPLRHLCPLPHLLCRPVVSQRRACVAGARAAPSEQDCAFASRVGLAPYNPVMPEACLRHDGTPLKLPVF